jgi:hypothetical protein
MDSALQPGVLGEVRLLSKSEQVFRSFFLAVIECEVRRLLAHARLNAVRPAAVHHSKLGFLKGLH